jgi:hypothetical protein
MSGSTTNEGYPYPIPSDFADVQDVFRLAMAIDADLRAEQAPFRSFLGRPSFIGRQSSNGAGFISGSQGMVMGAVDWDNTGGISAGSTSWKQPLGQQPSWWLFGVTILVAIISGTPAVGDMNMGQIQVATTDQVSGVSASTFAYQRNDETNTNGEWINFCTAAAIYRGTVSAALILNGSTQKAVQSGSRLWGMYLGPVV